MAQIQAVNQHAMRKFSEFEFAMQHVANSLAETEALIKSMNEGQDKRIKGFQVPTKKELMELRKKAVAALDALRRAAKQYEAELISRGWRV